LSVSAGRARSVLYQRGVYPPDTFEQQKHYGLTMTVTTDPGVAQYLSSVLQQMSGAPAAPVSIGRSARACPPLRRARRAQIGCWRASCRRWCWWSPASRPRRSWSAGRSTSRPAARRPAAGARPRTARRTLGGACSGVPLSLHWLHDRRRRCVWARRPGRRPRSRRARSRPRYRPSSGRRALLGPPAAAARARTLPGRARTLPGRARTLRGADSTEPRPQGHPVTRAQITASVTFLPLLQDACTFDLLVYADSDSPVPGEWCARPGAAPPGSGERRPRGAGGCVRACGLTADLPAASMSRPAYLHAPQARCLCRPSPACCRPRAYLADHQ